MDDLVPECRREGDMEAGLPVTEDRELSSRSTEHSTFYF